MLILMRRAGERLIIGNDIIVKVIEVEGNRVRLGIEAPKDIPVHREEIYKAIQREQQGLPPLARKHKTG